MPIHSKKIIHCQWRLFLYTIQNYIVLVYCEKGNRKWHLGDGKLSCYVALPEFIVDNRPDCLVISPLSPDRTIRRVMAGWPQKQLPGMLRNCLELCLKGTESGKWELCSAKQKKLFAMLMDSWWTGWMWFKIREFYDPNSWRDGIKKSVHGGWFVIAE